MWNKQQNDAPSYPPSQSQGYPGSSAPTYNAPASAAAPRTSAPAARDLSRIGSGIQINGKVSGDEDLQIDGKVDGPISLSGQRLTVGRSAQLNSEIHAREVVVYGKVTGNIRAEDRVEIKKDGAVIGDVTTARISVEDGAYFKGRIEIDATKAPVESDRELVGASA
ncbi:MAG: polymer-forming cytoskeletal protein [Candidatus Acidiferrales bacterium]|jgi:cytoskeletal protein CcmA (bactofilin family)